MQKSDYRKALEKLEANKCKDCNGSGSYNDAEPGDISYRECQCSTCDGTGFKEY